MFIMLNLWWGKWNEKSMILFLSNDGEKSGIFLHNHIFLRDDESLPMQSAISRMTIYYLMSDEKNWCI